MGRTTSWVKEALPPVPCAHLQLELGVRTAPFSLKLFSSEYFIAATRRETKAGKRIPRSGGATAVRNLQGSQAWNGFVANYKSA